MSESNLRDVPFGSEIQFKLPKFKLEKDIRISKTAIKKDAKFYNLLDGSLVERDVPVFYDAISKNKLKIKVPVPEKQKEIKLKNSEILANFLSRNSG